MLASRLQLCCLAGAAVALAACADSGVLAGPAAARQTTAVSTRR